jgi:hypothetical protein
MQLSPRIMWIDLQHAGYNIRIYSLYAPTNCPNTAGNEAARSGFWKTLQKEVDQASKNTEQLFLVDLNATTDLVRHLQPTNFGRNKHYTSDFNCNENGLAILNTFFQHKTAHLITQVQ